MYEALNLTDWPFKVVPDPEFAKIWAGRSQTKKDIDHLIWKMQFTPKSNMRLLWANFGMGKTHTLLHLRYLCEQTKNKLVPVYAVMPSKPTGFLDIYRVIVSELPLGFLGDQLVKLGNNSSGSVSLHPMFSKSPGVVSALLAFRTGDFEKTIAAQQWLRAQPGLSAKELKTIGVSYRIKTAEDAVNALTSLAQLATYKAPQVGKLVVLLDEYQRIGELREKVRSDINAGIHSLYNANSTGMELLLTFSFGNQENVMYFLSSELKSRVELQNIKLDLLSKSEAVEFLRDILAQFRIKNNEYWAFPFSPDAIMELVTIISEEKALTPRRIMQYADHVLMERLSSDIPLNADHITVADIRKILDVSQLGALDVD
jgi:hypothetical protein